MRLRYMHQGMRYDVDARIDDPAAQVSDLCEGLGLAPQIDPSAGGLFVDGFYRPGYTELEDAGLHEGAMVGTETASEGAGRPEYDEGQPALRILTGSEAGQTIPLLVNTEYHIGRGPDCHIRLSDQTVSRLHARIAVLSADTVIVDNESSSSGTLIDGAAITEPTTIRPGQPFRVGNVVMCIDALEPSQQVGGFQRGVRYGPNGTVSFNRPPRVVHVSRQEQLEAPTAPKQAGKPPFSAAAMVAPLPMGLIMAFAMHNMMFLVMIAASPLMAVGNWWESKHQSSKALRASSRQYARELEEFEEEVEGEYREEIHFRRTEIPHLAEIVTRAALPSIRLWERRYFHEDFLTLPVGFSDESWEPSLRNERHKELSEEPKQILAGHALLADVPATVDLKEGGVVGIAGDREIALRVAAALTCEAATLHGPADLRIGVMVSGESTLEWEWAKWLPHIREQLGGGERRLIAAGVDHVNDLLTDILLEGESSKESGPAAALGQEPGGGGKQKKTQTTLYVIDGDDLLSGRASPARRLLSETAGPAAGIVVAPTVDRLPALCTAIIEVRSPSDADLTRPHRGRATQRIRIAPLNLVDAEQVALNMSAFDDPEQHVAGADLPPAIRLGALLGVERWNEQVVAKRWNGANSTKALRGQIGVQEDGPFELDFDRHGPHGLIGGTTGSGKSELLRSIVAGLAVNYPPDQLTFGLFDFKGGSTFTELGKLPHTVGMASDLDVNLAKRALHCLRAELLHRELVFDQAGVADLVDYNQRRDRGDPRALEGESLPRLVVIIDEFAAMAKELSEEIGAIADLTARGRSLGVHLLLATQKPSTAVNAEVRTNTRLRISLKVEDRQDSIDVVGIPDAAAIDHKGRGYFRMGQSEVLPIQSALSTAPVGDGGPPPVIVTPFSFRPYPETPPKADTESDINELNELVTAIVKAHETSGQPWPRLPWPPPLPNLLTLDELRRQPVRPGREPDDLYFALGDDPGAQTRYPVGWPMRSGNMIFYGVIGSGTTTALASVALSFCQQAAPAEHHLYVLYGSNELNALEDLPHCGGVIRPTDRDRQLRLLRRLSLEMARRRSLPEASDDRGPDIVVLVDNMEGLRTVLEEGNDLRPWEQFVRIFADGPEVGIYVVCSSSRVGGVPTVLASSTPTKLMFRLADTGDYSLVGLRKSQLPTFVPGRAVTAEGQAVQVAVPTNGIEAMVEAVRADFPDRTGGPAPMAVLEDRVGLDPLLPLSNINAERWHLAVGQRDVDLEPAILTLYEGEHALVCGRARSGRSTTLRTVARSLLAADPAALVLGVCTKRSPLQSFPEIAETATTAEDVATLCNRALMSAATTLVLIDDAEMIDDSEMRIAGLLGGAPPNLRIVAAGNPDVIRSNYGDWTATLRRSRTGFLLQPTLDRDGELLSARLPYKVTADFPPGRGFLVCNNEADIVHLAT